ncbi:hypothetical protein ACFRI7_24360 [Streptomyces sp. NPDC056716]|uniref:hypothetical protein n=1 Tax=unclassified Streptomyces TaxID=2593676 RepID=UPI00367F0375
MPKRIGPVFDCLLRLLLPPFGRRRARLPLAAGGHGTGASGSVTVPESLRGRGQPFGEVSPEGWDGVLLDAGTAVVVRPYLPVSEAARERERQRIRDWQERERQRLRGLGLKWGAADGPVGPVCGDASAPQAKSGGAV